MLGVLAVSGVAAATGELPASAQQVAHRVLGRAGVPAPGAAAKGRGHAVATTRTTRAAAQGSPTTQRSETTTTIQDAARVRLLNLCHAWSDWSDHLRQRGQFGGGSGGDGWNGRYGGSGTAGAGVDRNWPHFSAGTAASSPSFNPFQRQGGTNPPSTASGGGSGVPTTTSASLSGTATSGQNGGGRAAMPSP
jgi:hypothetical protein